MVVAWSVLAGSASDCAGAAGKRTNSGKRGAYQEALVAAKAQQFDLAVLVHGSDWNRVGERFFKDVWQAKELRHQLASGFVLLDFDYLEHPTAKQKQSFDQRTKGFQLKFGCYPVLVLIDPNGRRSATVSGSAFPTDVRQTAEWLIDQRQRRRQRDLAIAQSAKANGIEKAKLLSQAILADAGLRKQLIKQLKEADPDNQSGVVATLEFDRFHVLGNALKMAGEGKQEEAIRWLDKQAKSKGLSGEQQQWLLAAKACVYRKWSGHDEEAWAEFQKAHELDPSTVIGRAASRLGLSVVGPVSLEFGWAPRHCSTTETTWQINAAGKFDTPNTYELRIIYRRGKSALTVAGVTLLDGERIVTKDIHEGVAGRKSRENIYRLSVEKPVKKPILKIKCRTNPDTNSRGVFELKNAEDA